MSRNAKLNVESSSPLSSEQWTKVNIGDIVETQYGLSLAGNAHGTVPMLGMKNIVNGKIVPTNSTMVCVDDADLQGYSLKKGDLLFNRTNSLDLVGKTAIFDLDSDDHVVFASYLIRLSVDRFRATPEYVCHFLNSESSQQRLKDMATPGVSQYNINPTTFRKHFQITLPPLPEQKAIAGVLSAWDRAIEQTTALIAAKQRLKQGLMQQLLTGRKRFPEFRGQDRPATRLNEVLTKVARAVEVNPTSTYREIGIRSHGKGIFHKDPIEGSALGDKRVYEVVPGCLTLNIVFAWERALAVSSDSEIGMIASHRFPMFRPDPKRVAIEFVLHYMLSDVGCNVLELASPGGAGRNRTISQEQFLKTAIPLPPLAEQQRIVDFINAAGKELKSLKKKLESLKRQKRGLMQQLLTGTRRIPRASIGRFSHD